MSHTFRKCFWVGTLAGLLAASPGVGFSQTQNSTTTPSTEAPDGSAADLKQDSAEAKALRTTIQQDREKLQADLKQYGKDSPQVKADRKQLHSDRLAFRKLHHDVERDRELHEERNEHHHHGHHHG